MAGPVDKAQISEPGSPADLDKLTDEILARPLFAAGRHPPAPPVEQTAEAVEPPKTPPVLTGRLTGMLIGPHDLKEAVFSREGNTTIAVQEGGVIDGWTVASIGADQVVLKSEFGENIVRPTFAQPSRPILKAPRGVRAKLAPNPARQPQPALAGPQAPNLLRPGNPALVRGNPGGAPNRLLAQPAASQSRNR